MAEYTCQDINGNEVNQFVFSDDGIVYGLIDGETFETTYEGVVIPYEDGNLIQISSECCTNMGFTFNNNNGNCHYQEPTYVDTDIKIVFNVDEYNGVVFSKLDSEECSLVLKFEYLIEYDSVELYRKHINENIPMFDLINGLELSVLLEKTTTKDTSAGEIFESNKSLETIIEQGFYDGVDVNESTGIILSGDNSNIVNNILQTELGGEYTSHITNSNWIDFEMVIDDLDIIESLINEEIKFSVWVKNNVADFSFIIDNIRIDKDCTNEYIERRVISEAPTFGLVKTVDNRKSWVNDTTVRDYNLPRRETRYDVEDERLIINTKEMELSTSTANAIEHNVINHALNNTKIIKGVEGFNHDHTSIDLSQLMSTEFKGIDIPELVQILRSELIDVKSRKTLVSYPTLELIYDRYMNSELYGNKSDEYTYSTISNFIELLGNHWVDLIEQVVPSTALWASTNKISNTIFRDNKFTYRKYSLNFCDDNRYKDDNIEINPPMGEVEVTLTTIRGNNDIVNTCRSIGINRISDDCFGVGSVIIVNN